MRVRRMSRGALLPAMVVAMAAVTGCSTGGGATEEVEGGDGLGEAVGSGVSAQGGVGAEALRGGEATAEHIVGVLAAAHEAEIEAAELVTGRLERPAVRDYAATVSGDHRSLNERGRSLGVERAVADSAVIRGLVAGVAELRRDIGVVGDSGVVTGLDQRYLERQVESHGRTLEFIDRAMASAPEGELATLLREARPVIRVHLERARQLLQQPGGTP